MPREWRLFTEGYREMKLKAVSGTMLMLLLIGISTLAFNIQPTKAEPTTIIVPDDYERIQWAINNASIGTTIFVKAGTYYENVVVDKMISLVGENRTTTVIDGNRTAFKDTILVASGNVLIANFTIRNAYYSGIKLDFYTSYNTIANNNITNNDDGIGLQDSSKNKILYNNIENNTWNGIILMNNEGGLGNEVIGNTIKNNHNGINSYDIDRVEANTFFHNNFINNKRQVIYYYSGYQDIWHNGYPSGGNYWSDHNPPDIYSGSYQNETGKDKIGDLPYVIDGNNTDRYPLIYPYGRVPGADLNDDGTVDIYDAIRLAIAFGSEPGDPSWNPYADLNEDGIIDIFDAIIFGWYFIGPKPLETNN